MNKTLCAYVLEYLDFAVYLHSGWCLLLPKLNAVWQTGNVGHSLCTHSVTARVRTILVLGYWVLGNIDRYWVILLLGIFFVALTPNTIPIRRQSAPSTCQWTII